MRTGKPGVVLVEGEKEKVNKFVVQIKALNWQKMTVNAIEDIEKTSNQGISSISYSIYLLCSFF